MPSAGCPPLEDGARAWESPPTAREKSRLEVEDATGELVRVLRETVAAGKGRELWRIWAAWASLGLRVEE